MTMKFTYSLFLSVQNFIFLCKFLSIKGFFRRFDSVADILYCFLKTLFFVGKCSQILKVRNLLIFNIETETQLQ